MRITRIADADEVARGAELFDDPPTPGPTADFLLKTDHHLFSLTTTTT